MPQHHFNFKQFRIWQEKSSFKIGTDSVLLGAWASVEGVCRAIDIGSGTGLLSLMIAQRSMAEIVAVDIDKLSAEEAEQNFLNSKWSERLKIIHSDIRNYSDRMRNGFDLVISNPPYFLNSLENPDERLSRARHTSDFKYNDLLQSVAGLMSEKGRFALVLPFAEANLFIAEAVVYGLYCNRMLKIKSLPSKPVKRLLMEFEREKTELKSSFLVIEKANRHEYSENYIALTRDFYLNF